MSRETYHRYVEGCLENGETPLDYNDFCNKIDDIYTEMSKEDYVRTYLNYLIQGIWPTK